MTDDRDQPRSAATYQSMVRTAEVLWQMPAMLFTAWWNALAVARPPRAVRPPERHCRCDQLVVPEPLEETGEHALFA